MYSLIFSKLYYSDIAESTDYIADVLQNPVAALRLFDEANQKIIEIKNNPRYRPLVNDEYLANLGYRFAIVKNYLLFYIIGEPTAERVTMSEGSRSVADNHIKIIRFLYGRMDWMNILKEKTVEEMME
ncbi:MAG: type II toxin-antitoxin system RelE/ParE family toxin [Treponema sp.]|nr:type II toxin-antitoxin system RelE/ParE family toxin [Treponema sp.]